MKLKVDQAKCNTTGMCVKKYPHLFRFQEGSKKAEVIEELVPVYLAPECKSIVEVCPSGAITIRMIFASQI